MRFTRLLAVVAAGAAMAFAGGCTTLLGDFRDSAGQDAAVGNDATAKPDPDSGSVSPVGASDDGGAGGTMTASDAGNGCAAGQIACASGCVMQNDLRTCGSCTNDCTTLPHIAATNLSCTGAVCTFTCLPGYAHCSTNPSDGCEVDLSSQGNCGSCQKTCSGTTPVCGPIDGGGAGCITGCPATAPNLCTASCSDLTTDDSHCGDCNTACTGGTTCQGGSCACPAPETSCGGACYTTQSDPSHCGAGCMQCPPPPNGAAICTGGACGAQCNAPYSSCGGANACAYNTSNDAAHCGASCAVCGGTAPVCLGGSCVACAPGATRCSGSTPQTCSTGGVWVSGSACASPSTCSGGSCTCASPYVACGSGCTSLSTDPDNCGACGRACAAGSSCSGSACHCPSIACGTQVCGCGATCCGTVCCSAQ